MQPAITVRPIFSADEIARRMKVLASELRHDAGDSEIFLLGILKGASVFLSDLMRNIQGDTSYGFIDVIRDVADETDALEIDFLSYTDIRNRDVYVLKDVVNSGVIENYLLAQLRMRYQPRRIRLVALLDKIDSRTVDVATDFRAFSIEEGTYVGYGLETNGRYANLPFIGRLD